MRAEKRARSVCEQRLGVAVHVRERVLQAGGAPDHEVDVAGRVVLGDEIRRLLELALGLGNDDDVPERRDRGRDRGFVLQVRRLHRDAQLAQVEQLGRARPGSEHALRVRAVNLVRAGRGALLALLVAKVRDAYDHV